MSRGDLSFYLIDELVYELYGITEEERKIIEKVDK